MRRTANTRRSAHTLVSSEGMVERCHDEDGKGEYFVTFQMHVYRWYCTCCWLKQPTCPKSQVPRQRLLKTAIAWQCFAKACKRAR